MKKNVIDFYGEKMKLIITNLHWIQFLYFGLIAFLFLRLFWIASTTKSDDFFKSKKYKYNFFIIFSLISIMILVTFIYKFFKSFL
jgi:hypothetical protein